MAYQLDGYSFEGAWQSTGPINDASGVYIIHVRIGDNWTLVDCGESATVRSRLDNHDRADCWRRKTPQGGSIWYSVHYTPGMQQAGRIAIEKDIRSKHSGLCGDQ